MRSIRRWFFAAALAVTGAWSASIVRSGAELLTLFEAVGDGAAAASGGDRAPPAAPAAKPEAALAAGADTQRAAPLAAERELGPSPQQVSPDRLSDVEIMRLLEDEIASDTDPAAAQELLRAFGDSLDARE